MTKPTPEEVQHNRELVKEFTEILFSMSNLIRRLICERKQIRTRLSEIKEELEDFKKKYPDYKE